VILLLCDEDFMNDADPQRDMLQRISSCAEALRQYADRLPGAGQESTAALTDCLQQLSLCAAAENLDSVHRVAARVSRSLTRPGELPSRLQQLESRNFSLAAEWLEQLARLYRSGMPEPKGLIYDLLYSFALLEQAVCAERAEYVAPSDIFDEDPVMTSDVWSSYVRDNDPFADDPGFGHLLDLMQRTLNHATDVQTDIPVDPFHQDPQIAAARPVVDMFAEDPSSGRNEEDNTQD
jgi:hypothetical protein